MAHSHPEQLPIANIKVQTVVHKIPWKNPKERIVDEAGLQRKCTLYVHWYDIVGGM